MKRSALGGVVMALSVVAALGFLGVAIEEFTYAADHPFAYGPAKVIAWGAIAGVVLAIAVAIVGYAFTRTDD